MNICLRNHAVAFVFFLIMGAASDVAASDASNPLLHDADLIIDVRQVDEVANSGMLEGAINIPHNELAVNMERLAAYRDKKVVLYCRGGRRAGFAKSFLRLQGFSNVVNAGAYEQLK